VYAGGNCSKTYLVNAGQSGEEAHMLLKARDDLAGRGVERKKQGRCPPSSASRIVKGGRPEYGASSHVSVNIMRCCRPYDTASGPPK